MQFITRNLSAGQARARAPKYLHFRSETLIKRGQVQTGKGG